MLKTGYCFNEMNQRICELVELIKETEYPHKLENMGLTLRFIIESIQC